MKGWNVMLIREQNYFAAYHEHCPAKYRYRGLLSWLKFVIGFLPFVLLLTAGRWKNGMGLSVCVYLGSYAILSGVLAHTGGAVMMLFGFLASMGTKFLPGGMLGVYFYAVPG